MPDLARFLLFVGAAAMPAVVTGPFKRVDIAKPKV